MQNDKPESSSVIIPVDVSWEAQISIVIEFVNTLSKESQEVFDEIFVETKSFTRALWHAAINEQICRKVVAEAARIVDMYKTLEEIETASSNRRQSND